MITPLSSASRYRSPLVSSADTSALSTGMNITVMSTSLSRFFAYSRLHSVRTWLRMACACMSRRRARSASACVVSSESKYAFMGTFASIGICRPPGRRTVMSGRSRPSSPSMLVCSLKSTCAARPAISTTFRRLISPQRPRWRLSRSAPASESAALDALPCRSAITFSCSPSALASPARFSLSSFSSVSCFTSCSRNGRKVASICFCFSAISCSVSLRWSSNWRRACAINCSPADFSTSKPVLLKASPSTSRACACMARSCSTLLSRSASSAAVLVSRSAMRATASAAVRSALACSERRRSMVARDASDSRRDCSSSASLPAWREASIDFARRNPAGAASAAPSSRPTRIEVASMAAW